MRIKKLKMGNMKFQIRELTSHTLGTQKRAKKRKIQINRIQVQNGYNGDPRVILPLKIGDIKI